MKEPDLTIEGSDLKRWSTDCVYAWKRGEQWLYIGASSRGLSRPLCHSVINVVEKIQESDTLQVWFFEPELPDANGISVSWPEFLRFETEMIRLHRPRFNVAENPNNKPRLSKRQIANLRREKEIAERKRRNEEAEIGWSDNQSWD